VSNSKKNLYQASVAVSLIGVFLLLTENFGAWQDRSSFYGVVEGYVWIGSEKAFPWAQIGILALSGCLLFIAYTSFKGYMGCSVCSLYDSYTSSQDYTGPQIVSPEQARLGYRASLAVVGLSLVLAIVFVFMVIDSEWWWLDTGFYGALVAGVVNIWIYRKLQSP